MISKQCTCCSQELPLVEFPKKPSGKYNRASWCKSCVKEKNAQRYVKDRDRIVATQRKWSDAQRKLIHGNFELYFKRLIKRVKTISVEDCLSLLEQQKGLCALSGVPLTCIVGAAGEHPDTNASLDRVVHGKEGGKYSKDNVRLVCARVNYMRADKTDEELLWWSKRIIDHGNNFDYTVSNS